MQIKKKMLDTINFLVNKLARCISIEGTKDFAYHVLRLNVASAYLTVELKSTRYVKVTTALLDLLNNGRNEEAVAFYELHKYSLQGANEWDNIIPLLIRRAKLKK